MTVCQQGGQTRGSEPGRQGVTRENLKETRGAGAGGGQPAAGLSAGAVWPPSSQFLPAHVHGFCLEPVARACDSGGPAAAGRASGVGDV